MTGDKFDTGKLRTDLIPSEPIEALATILTHGAKKYDDNNWMKGLPFRRVYAAMLRHLLAYRRGEYQDQESGHPHLWHAFCNLAFLIYYNDDKHYAKYEEFNDFKKEWAQKLQKQPDLKVEKGCETCKHLGKNLMQYPCWGCIIINRKHPNWEPQNGK